MSYSRTQQRAIISLLETFDQWDVLYVIPRGYEDLPTRVPGSDLDVLVAPNSFEQATKAARDVGLEPLESVGQNARDLFRRGVEKPRAAAALVLESPEEIVPYVRRNLTPRAPTQRGVINRHFGLESLDVHLTNHLAYTSTLNGKKIRVDPAVEEAMLERRVNRGDLYVPATPDELAHLVCRGVFDYEGEFPAYYSSRCDELVDELEESSTGEQFKRLLSDIFFEADELVYEHVMEREYDEIRRALYQFADY